VDTFDGPVDLLRLNPGDNQGVRYLLVAALLELGRNEDAGKLLDEHDDDIQALWPYARVIWQFRTEGGTARTRAALDDAVAANPHFVEYLLDPDSGPLEQPPHFALGSREEAVYVADELSSVCEAIPGLRTGCDPRRTPAWAVAHRNAAQPGRPSSLAPELTGREPVLTAARRRCHRRRRAEAKLSYGPNHNQ
jgi:hypothetical protein